MILYLLSCFIKVSLSIPQQKSLGNTFNIFQDKKNSCIVYLEHAFSNAHLDNFLNVFAYCQVLKTLVDHLSTIGVFV